MGFFSRFRQQVAPTPPVEGLLGYYGLGDWWLKVFTANERKEIEAMWGYVTVQGSPMMNERPLTRGHVTSNPLSAAEFLMVMLGRVTEKKTADKVRTKVRELRGGDLPGFVNGKTYAVYMSQAKELLENGRIAEADPIVDKALTGWEDKQRIGPFLTELSVVPPAPYWDFAVLYRRLKDYAREVAVLERFTRQPHQTGGASGKNLERLEKARALLAGHETP
jgi:hypothetical protein